MTELIDALAVTVELTGTEISEGAARVMLQDLSDYPEDQVIRALHRCRLELKSRLTVSDIIKRLDDGRPDVEEAWAMIPHNEDTTIVWTEEMSVAFGVAQLLLVEGDAIAARMAFKEKYTKEVTMARNEKREVSWSVSLGHDKNGREGPVVKAANEGKLSLEHAQKLIPYSAQLDKLSGLLPNPEGVKRIADLSKKLNTNFKPVNNKPEENKKLTFKEEESLLSEGREVYAEMNSKSSEPINTQT